MAMKYIGAGAYIHGVPARDLTDEEEARLAGTIKEQERLTGLKLYEPIKPPAPPKSSANVAAKADEKEQ